MQENPKPPRPVRVAHGIDPSPSTSGSEIESKDESAAVAALSGTRPSFIEVGEEWLGLQTHLRPRTHDLYRTALHRHLKPRIGAMPIGDVDEDVIAGLIAELEVQGLSGWTIRGILV